MRRRSGGPARPVQNRVESNRDLVDLMSGPLQAAGKIDRTFAAFDRANPRVYQTLEALAKEWHRAGHGRCGIGMLWERMRWELTVATAGDEPFKLNNNYRSRYVRKLLGDHPEWVASFELRALSA